MRLEEEADGAQEDGTSTNVTATRRGDLTGEEVCPPRIECAGRNAHGCK